MGLIHEALSAMVAESEAIAKDRKNVTQGYSFRGIDDVYNAIHPLFAKYKIFSTPEVLEDRTEERTTQKGTALIYRVLKIKYTFYASDGSNIFCIVIGEGMDSGDKASNKAMAVAHKYAIIQLLAIPTEEPKDPENDDHSVIPKAFTQTQLQEKKDLELSQDYRDSKGNYSQAVDPGPLAIKGDGIAMAMRSIRVELNNLMVAVYKGKEIFDVDDKKDIEAECHPGNKTLVPSKNNLEYAEGIVRKWKQELEFRKSELDGLSSKSNDLF